MKSWNDFNYRRLPVLSNIQVASGSYILTFKREFDFIAGQVIGIGVSEKIPPRLYSIASGEKEDHIEILYTEKPDGTLTPMLSLLKSGDTILVTDPFGSFTNSDQSPIWIAVGTGIAPFMSRLLSGKGEGATLIHGVRTPDFFYYQNLLKERLGDNYIQCCSRCTVGPFYNGRVTSFLQHWDKLDLTRKYYLCGSAEMVVETRDKLIALGVPFANVNAEIYF
jgi:ferredoxin--NADP+ reductase